MRKFIVLGTLAVGCLALITGAQAQTTLLNFTSFMYESDNTPGVQGFPPSAPGDVLRAVGFVESIVPDLDWDTGQVQLTVYFNDLISIGEVDLGGGVYYIVYTGGTLDIVAQRYDAPDYTAPQYGTDPPNATAPSTFIDGEVYLRGSFYNFYMTYMPGMSIGNFEGHLNWTGGTQLNSLFTDPQGYTVAGTVDASAAPVPAGYDLEADGYISFDAAIPADEATWGQLKNLYR